MIEKEVKIYMTPILHILGVFGVFVGYLALCWLLVPFEGGKWVAFTFLALPIMCIAASLAIAWGFCAMSSYYKRWVRDHENQLKGRDNGN